jgi:hypothetical protein
MPKGELVDTVRTKYNGWTVYKVYESFGYSVNVYENDSYKFSAKDLRWIFDEIQHRDR